MTAKTTKTSKKKSATKNSAAQKKQRRVDVMKRLQGLEGDKGYLSSSDANAAQGKKPNPPPRGRGKATEIAISEPNYQEFELVLTGIEGSSLISHKWARKAVFEMLAKQMKFPVPAKTAKDPHQDFIDSLYPYDVADPKAGYGMPAIAFKNSSVGACRFVSMKMTEARGAFHVMGDLVQILGRPTNRLDQVRVASGTADLRFRGEFLKWAAVLKIAFNADILSPAQIINLFNHAGRGQGIGEFRPEKNGNRGMFEVCSEAQARRLTSQLKPANRREVEADTSWTDKLIDDLERYLGVDKSKKRGKKAA
jgi:hypothetical protein